MWRIVLSSVVSLAVPYFSALSHKSNDFQEKNVIDYYNVSFVVLYKFPCKISHFKE
jgi:hypothetical protein